MNPPSYTPEQRIQLRAEFAEIPAKYRTRRKWILWAVIAAFSSSFLSIIGNITGLHLAFATALAPLSFLGIPVVVVLALLIKGLLKCPGCQLSLETLGPYCPECGSPGLQAATGWLWRKPAHCQHCDRDLPTGGKRGRRYTVRACSHCGLYLDAGGV